MCAINPTHKKRLILDVYTAEPGISEEKFVENVIKASLLMEIQLNSTTELRWHVKETTQEAD